MASSNPKEIEIDNVQKELGQSSGHPSGIGGIGQQEETGNVSAKPPLASKRKNMVDTNLESNKSRRKTSLAWEHFTLVPNCQEGEEKAACNHCGQKYLCNVKRNGTSAMMQHLKDKCSKLPKKDLKQSLLSFESSVNSSGVAQLKAIAFSQEGGRKYLAMMVIKDELPFRIVEGEGFKAYSNYMNHRFKIPCRTTVAKDCIKMYLEEMAKVKKSLKGQRLSFTTDTWTSIQTMNYMCLTGHWIDKDWKYQKRILNFCQIDDHRGEIIGDCIEQCLIEWGIDRILAITVDNASSNDSAICNLKASTGYKLKSVVANHEHLHMRCCAHILNLVVKSGLRQIFQSILRIHKAVKYVVSSAPRLKAFEDCVKATGIDCKKGLCMDVDTRWNSTYLMLDSAEKYERAFARLERDGRFLRYFIDPKDIRDDDDDEMDTLARTAIMPPNKDDWKDARRLLKFLKMFYEVTRKFSASTSVTSNEFFHDLMDMRKVLEKRVLNSDPMVASMATKMLAKFNKYWDTFESINGLLYVAVILDPRYKHKYVRISLANLYTEAQANAYADRVDSMLSNLYLQYEERSRRSCVQFSTSLFHVAPRTEEDEEDVNDDDDDDDDDIVGLKFRDEWNKQILADKSSDTISDLAKYLQDPLEITSETFDILSWWKVNGAKYPIMADIARDVLAIPVSTVASESAFSTGGRVLDPHRSSLKPRTVQALVCAQNWLRVNQHTNNDEEEEFDENKILEELEEELEREDDESEAES